MISCIRRYADLNALAQLQCKDSGPEAAAAARLEAFANANTEMVQATRTVVYSRGQQLQQEIAERGQFFGWQALVLFLVSRRWCYFLPA